MLGAIILYILCGLAGLAALYLLAMCFLEPDTADIGGFFVVIICFISALCGVGGWGCEREAKAEYKTYYAEVEVIALECSRNTATASFISDELDGYVYITLDQYSELQPGDSIVLSVTEKIYQGYEHGHKTYEVDWERTSH